MRRHSLFPAVFPDLTHNPLLILIGAGTLATLMTIGQFPKATNSENSDSENHNIGGLNSNAKLEEHQIKIDTPDSPKIKKIIN
jgi:hypothetical protein